MGNKQSSTEERARHVRLMEDSLRDKFKHGCDYNMKIIVRGARKTGKTSLLNRLQGLQMPNSYIPTPEIRIGTINWTGSALTADHVKVEAWEVIDHGIMKEDASLSADTLAGLSPRTRKTKNSNWERTKKQRGAQTVGALDASMVDVYKGTDGVIVMVDVRDKKTFQYAAMLLDGMPVHIPTLIIGNFADCLDTEREVSVDDLASLLTAPAKHQPKSPSAVVGMTSANTQGESTQITSEKKASAEGGGGEPQDKAPSMLSTPPSTPPASDDDNDGDTANKDGAEGVGGNTVGQSLPELDEDEVVAVAKASAAIAAAVERGQLPPAELLQPSSSSSSRSVSGGKVRGPALVHALQVMLSQ
jgi:GTPase SAR1 family protein